MEHVAEEVGSSVVWVEHCMLTYGRRPQRPGRESAGSRQEQLEHFEDEEPEEEFREDKEEPGERERQVRQERPRVLHLKPPPTPSYEFYEQQLEQ